MLDHFAYTFAIFLHKLVRTSSDCTLKNLPQVVNFPSVIRLGDSETLTKDRKVEHGPESVELGET
jgi:hypothetical protein